MLTLTLTLAALAYLATANANFAQCGDGLAPNATREGVPTPEFTPEGGDWFPDKVQVHHPRPRPLPPPLPRSPISRAGGGPPGPKSIPSQKGFHIL